MQRIPALIAAFCLSAGAQAATTVLATRFNQGLPPQLDPGTAQLVPVQGFAGLGRPGNRFGGQFLRSAGGNTVTLTLTGLPAHRHLSIGFLLAAIDSLDGSGVAPADDNLAITLDGATIFLESFANATPDQVQSYEPPAGVELARRVDLGFTTGSFYLDSAYDMSADRTFRKIAHTASTAVLTFTLTGAGVQDIDDESWAMDNLVVRVGP